MTRCQKKLPIQGTESTILIKAHAPHAHSEIFRYTHTHTQHLSRTFESRTLRNRNDLVQQLSALDRRAPVNCFNRPITGSHCAHRAIHMAQHVHRQSCRFSRLNESTFPCSRLLVQSVAFAHTIRHISIYILQYSDQRKNALRNSVVTFSTSSGYLKSSGCLYLSDWWKSPDTISIYLPNQQLCNLHIVLA